MKLLILALFLLSHARPADDVVSSPEATPPATSNDFPYQSSTKKIDTGSWMFQGSRIKYTADDLVTGSCEETNTVRVLFPKAGDSSNYECENPALMSGKLAEMINLYMKSCTQEALTAAGVRTNIQRIDINSMGIINARRVNQGGGHRNCKGQAISARSGRRCSVSYHATGRAIDIDSVTVTGTDGNSTKYPLACVTGGKTNDGFDKNCNRSGTNGKFYDAFNSCFNRNLKKHATCADGVIDCTDAQHKDHVHMSLPLCPRPRGIAKS